MAKKQYTKGLTPREARPRSERLRALGIHGSTVSGTASSDYLALKAAFSSHAADSDIHVTAEEKAAWDLVASLFGVDTNGDIYSKDNRGFWTNSFLSSRGADPEAGQGGTGGIDEDELWTILATSGTQKINASHIPALSISKITGLQDALDSKLSAITGDMVESVLTGTVTSHNHDGMYAPLSGGVIPSQYLPSYVDDVLEYASKSSFPASGEAGKIYVALDTNLTYRWGGSSYVEISPSLALGYTSSTAYPGNEGAANASAIATLQGYFTGGAANKVAHALTISYDSGTAVKFDGSSALSVTIPSDEQRALWDKICALFNIDADGNVYVTSTRGFYSNSFLSARGADPEAGQGGTGGLDIDAMWDALATSGAQKIDASHIPALGLLSGTVSNAQLANSSITVAGVEVPLGSAVSAAQLATALNLDGYLPLTGGTLTGMLNLKYSRAGVSMLDITNTAGGEVFFRMYSGSTYAGAFTANHTSYGTAIYNPMADSGKRYLGITNAGVPHFQGSPLLHSGNYTSYTVTKTGGGASGTWPISISGDAGRATYLTSTYTGSGGLQPPSYFNGMGLKVNMMNNPVSYCDVIVVNGYGGSGSDVPYINALAFKKSSDVHGDVWHARGDYGGSSWGTWYKFLDEYNCAGILDTRYVKKAGDTMTGTLFLNTSGTESYNEGIRVNRVSSDKGASIVIGGQANSTNNTSVGAWVFGASPSSNSYNLVIAENGSANRTGLTLGGNGSSTFTWKGNKIWHAGNDGSGSGLDADLLDGYHANRFDVVTNLGGCQDYGYYVIGLLQVTDYTTLGNHADGRIVAIRQNGNNVVVSTIYSLSTEYNTNKVRFGYMNVGTSKAFRPCTFTYNGKKWAGFVVQALSAYTMGVYCCRYGLINGERSTPFMLKYYTQNTATVNNEEIYDSLVIDGADLSDRGISTGTINAALSGNASSATKLATARSIWGQPFGGENNVRGDMTGVDWINSGLLISTYGSNSDNSDTTQFNTTGHNLEFGGAGYAHKAYYFRPLYGSQGATRASVYIQNASASDTPTFFTTHAFYNNGNAYHSGNVGIGTPSPSYKLHVAGTIYATTGIWSSGWLSFSDLSSTSDRKFKDGIAPLDKRNALDVIRALKPSTWTWNALSKVRGRSAGFVAQDVAGVLPDAIREIGDDRHLALNYQMLHAYEVAALQEHDDEIGRLRTRVAELERQLKEARTWQH